MTEGSLVCQIEQKLNSYPSDGSVPPMNAWKSRDRKQVIWPVAGIVIGALAGTNPFYQPRIPLEVGILAGFADLVLVLILSAHPNTARAGVLVAGLFLAVPCFLWASPLSRGLLMCCMAFPLAIVTLPLVAPVAGFRARLAYLFTWLGSREIKRRPRSFDLKSLLQLIAATVVLVVAIASVKAVSGSNHWLLLRWLTGGIMILAFAEMATACHNFLTALMGLTAPSLLQSPYLSTSVTEFWTKRWNPAVSVLVFRKYFFAPLAQRGAVYALFAAFFASAIGHVLLPYMATGRWGISLMCGAFFLVQPLFIVAERRMKVRQWRPAAGRAWTLACLTIASPLFVEPALQIIEPSWGAPDKVLLPTAAALGFVIFVNGFFSLASLASRPELAPSNLQIGCKTNPSS